MCKETLVEIGLTTRSTATTKLDQELVGWLHVTLCYHGSDWANGPLHAIIGKPSPCSACSEAPVVVTIMFSYSSPVTARCFQSPYDHLELQ